MHIKAHKKKDRRVHNGGANIFNPKKRTDQRRVGCTRPPLPLPPVGSEPRVLPERVKAEIMVFTAIVFTSFLSTGITLAVSFFTIRSAIELESSPLELILSLLM
ncbi:hypothetical protein YC2023_090282 [Brassica napus]